MNYAGIQTVEKRIKSHKIKQKEYSIIPEDASPIEKQALSREKDIEDRIIAELEQLKKEMMMN